MSLAKQETNSNNKIYFFTNTITHTHTYTILLNKSKQRQQMPAEKHIINKNEAGKKNVINL